LGADGYLGWSLALHLSNEGHMVYGLDNFMRRSWVRKMNSETAIPVGSIQERLQGFFDTFGYLMRFETISMEDYPQLCQYISDIKPDAIVHLAECPSAPYSMHGVHEAAFVMRNNVIGTLYLLHAMRENAPDAHLIKLGTMGEYGTPDMDIPEGFFEVSANRLDGQNKMVRLPFPRQAGSWYHWSKVHDSMNVKFACDIWGLRSTDIMQGVVYGTQIDAMKGALGLIDPRLRTRLDFDEAFGTVINRFVCQAIVGHPLTVYGDVGKQTRGFLPLRDSMQCLTLAIDNPPEEAGEYRVFNQFENTYSVVELAEKVQSVGNDFDLNVEIGHYEKPRTEVEEHYYNPAHQHLFDLGYKPSSADMMAELSLMFFDLMEYKDRIKKYKDALIPKIRWRGEHEEVDRIR